MTLPDCGACDAFQSLQPHGKEVQGHIWTFCTCCAKPQLVRLSDQKVIRVGKP